MKNYFTLFIILLLMISCKNEQSNVLPPQTIKVFEVKKAKTVPIFQEFVGQIYGERDIPIRARVQGFLQKIYFEEGSRVKKGQLLYAIEPDPFMQEVAEKESMVAQARTLLIQSESDLLRIKPLAEIDAVSKRELDMAQAKRDADISSLEAAKANLNIANINLGYAKMYAPINGIIGKTLAREGEFVGKEPNPVILNTVSEIKIIRVQFFLSENEYLRIAKNYVEKYKQKIQKNNQDLPVELILADGTFYDQKGKIDFIDRNVDPSTGAILLQASFPNPDGLIRPGQFARVKTMIKEEIDALLLPQKCITELQGQFSVFVVNSENKIERKQVEIGDKIDDLWIIKEGINSGDKVVLEGLQKVASGMEVIPEVTEFKSQSNKQ